MSSQEVGSNLNSYHSVSSSLSRVRAPVCVCVGGWGWGGSIAHTPLLSDLIMANVLKQVSG